MANGKCDYGEMVTFRTAKVTISDKGLPHADRTDYYRMAADEIHFKSKFPSNLNITISTENIASSAELWVKKCAQEDVPGVTTKIGSGRDIDIMFEGEKVATCEIAFKPQLNSYMGHSPHFSTLPFQPWFSSFYQISSRRLVIRPLLASFFIQCG